jgi:ABC-2 type transport system ATP-binding protein
LNAIAVEHLRKKHCVSEEFRKARYIEAVKDVSFQIGKGAIHALLGPNGAGKTTITRILSALLLPDGDAQRFWDTMLLKMLKE